MKHLCTLCPTLIVGLLVFQMSERGFESSLPQGRGAHGQSSSFFGEWLMREATADPGTLESSSELELSFDDDIIQEVEDYTEAGVKKIIVRPQSTGGDLPPAINPGRTRSSACANASTSSVYASTSGSRYVYRD